MLPRRHHVRSAVALGAVAIALAATACGTPSAPEHSNGPSVVASTNGSHDDQCVDDVLAAHPGPTTVDAYQLAPNQPDGEAANEHVF